MRTMMRTARANVSRTLTMCQALPAGKRGWSASFSPPPGEADALVAPIPVGRKWRLRAQRQTVRTPEEWGRCKGMKAMAGSEAVRKRVREDLREEVIMPEL